MSLDSILGFLVLFIIYFYLQIEIQGIKFPKIFDSHELQIN